MMFLGVFQIFIELFSINLHSAVLVYVFVTFFTHRYKSIVWVLPRKQSFFVVSVMHLQECIVCCSSTALTLVTVPFKYFQTTFLPSPIPQKVSVFFIRHIVFVLEWTFFIGRWCKRHVIFLLLFLVRE